MLPEIVKDTFLLLIRTAKKIIERNRGKIINQEDSGTVGLCEGLMGLGLEVEVGVLIDIILLLL